MPLALTAAIVHLGLVDGSAGIAVSESSFITATDEFNLIQSFSTAPGSAGVTVLDLDMELPWYPAIPKFNDKGKAKGFEESDIEGAARIGNLIYWIGSHGADGDGNPASARRVLFATRINTGANPLLSRHGMVYTSLVKDLIATPALADYRFAESSGVNPKNPPLAGKPGGLNIESLCTASDGKTLLIGFRNPVPGSKALILPLKNAGSLVADGDAKAEFGTPIPLDLGGLGIRDMVWWRNKYLILAGHHDKNLDGSGNVIEGAPAPQLFRWTGAEDDLKPGLILENELRTLNPEALIVFPNDRILILSDDGGHKDKGKRDNPAGEFRSVWLDDLK